jgi:hypothetical protein
MAPHAHPPACTSDGLSRNLISSSIGENRDTAERKTRACRKSEYIEQVYSTFSVTVPAEHHFLPSLPGTDVRGGGAALCGCVDMKYCFLSGQ